MSGEFTSIHDSITSTSSAPCDGHADLLPRARHRRRVPAVFTSLRAVLGLLVVTIVMLWAIAPQVFAPYDPNDQVLIDRLKPPLTGMGTDHAYLLGTDHLGRDILSRVIHSARTSVVIGLMVVLLSGGLGITIGLLSGYLGGWVDDVLMRLADIQLAFPFILLAVTIIGVLGNSLCNIIIAVGISSWVSYSRVVRGETLAIRERCFVEAAHSIGVPTWRILTRHILPNIAASIIVISTFGVASAILAEAGLSFLGLGVPQEVPSWGSMLADGRRFVDTAWWLAVLPGIAIFATILAINLVGDFLRDVLDPYMAKC